MGASAGAMATVAATAAMVTMNKGGDCSIQGLVLGAYIVGCYLGLMLAICFLNVRTRNRFYVTFICGLVLWVCTELFCNYTISTLTLLFVLGLLSMTILEMCLSGDIKLPPLHKIQKELRLRYARGFGSKSSRVYAILNKFYKH